MDMKLLKLVLDLKREVPTYINDNFEVYEACYQDIIPSTVDCASASGEETCVNMNRFCVYRPSEDGTSEGTCTAESNPNVCTTTVNEYCNGLNCTSSDFSNCVQFKNIELIEELELYTNSGSTTGGSTTVGMEVKLHNYLNHRNNHFDKNLSLFVKPDITGTPDRPISDFKVYNAKYISTSSFTPSNDIDEDDPIYLQKSQSDDNIFDLYVKKLASSPTPTSAQKYKALQTKAPYFHELLKLLYERYEDLIMNQIHQYLK